MTEPFSRPVHGKASYPDADRLKGEVLGFLAEDPERVARFLAATGMLASDLRAASVEPGFLESLVDHLCADEPLLVAFAKRHGYDPAEIEFLRQSLAPPFEG